MGGAIWVNGGSMHKFLVASIIMSVAVASPAAILVNQDPSTGPYGGSWANTTGSQILADSFMFGTSAQITGYDYYSNFNPPGGNSWELNLWSDSGSNSPGSALVTLTLSHSSYTLWGTQSGTNIYQAVFDFAPISVAANTKYWINLSANGFEGALTSTNPSSNGDGTLSFRSNPSSAWSTISSIGDVTYRLRGEPVPEPASLAILGLGALALLRKRR